MKNFIILLIAIGLMLMTLAHASTAQEEGLGKQLDRLTLPSNMAGGEMVKEKLYSVQSRHNPLAKRFELSLGGTQQVSDTGFISQKELTLGGRYYITSKWSVGMAYSYAFNSLTDSSDHLFKEEGIMPKVPFVKQRAELTARYLSFYGKFRLSMDRVLYFDHFISLGPAFIKLDTGDSIGGIADTGLAFWFGRKWNTVLGIKNYVFEKRQHEDKNYLANQTQVYLNIGLLFGGI